MSMNVSGLGNTYNGINTNSKQYKALKEKGWLSGVMQNEAMIPYRFQNPRRLMPVPLSLPPGKSYTDSLHGLRELELSSLFLSMNSPLPACKRHGCVVCL